jgi:hypothetical protein
LAKKEGNSYLTSEQIKDRLISFVESKKDITTFVKELDFLSSI